MDDPQFMRKLSNAVETGREMDWLYSTFAYNSMVQLNETPIINFRNYRYKIVEIFVMSYKQERAVLDVEIATPDTLTVLGTYAEHKLSDKLLDLNNHIATTSHSWNKILLLARHDVRLLVNMAFAVMHLFAADMVALSDNEIVYCYILAAAVISSIDKNTQARLNRDILKRGLKRAQFSISERPSSLLSLANKPPKESSRSESSYVNTFAAELAGACLATVSRNSPDSDSDDRKHLTSQVEIFIATARRLSLRKACLQNLADSGKDLPQLGRLLHLGRTQDTEPNQLAYYIGEDVCAMPASNLGAHRYKKSDSRSVYKKGRW